MRGSVMTYQGIMNYMDEISSYGIVPGLDSIRELCRRIGDPQNRLRFIHIAGTNGKGSVLAYVSTICTEAGYRVGRYISPTIFEYRERFQINGKMVPKTVLCKGMEIVIQHAKEMADEGLPHPTPFEIETAFSFWYFDEMKCDLVVLETGMGGLLDATNLIETTLVSVVTSISMDHMQFLGRTLSDIARQKAGIIKEKTSCVSVKQKEEAMQVIEEVAALKDVELFIADQADASHINYGLKKQQFDYKEYKKIEIPLSGKVQIQNAILAINVIEVLRRNGYKISDKALREGFMKTQWIGRFSVIKKKPLFIVDGAHNEDAAFQLASSIEEYLEHRRIIFIMGMLKDKEYEKVIQITEKYADQIITITPPNQKRALPAIDLAREIAKIHPNVTAADSVEEAVEVSTILAGKDDVILAFGSLSFLGHLIEVVQDKYGKL